MDATKEQTVQYLPDRYLHGELANAAAVGAIRSYRFTPARFGKPRRWKVVLPNGSPYTWTAGMVEAFCLGVRAAGSKGETA